MLDIKEINKKILRNASWLFGDKSASSIFSGLQTVIVARMLGVDDYGLLVLVIVYIDVINQFFDLRVWETATKYIGSFWASGEEEKTRSMIKLSYVLDVSSGVLAFAIAIASAKLVSKYVIHSPVAYIYIWIYSISLFINTANSTSIAILRVFNKFKSIALIRSSQSLFRLIVVSIFLLAGFEIKGVLFGYIVASLLGFFLRIIIVDRTLYEHNLGKWWQGNLALIKNHFKGIAWFLGNTSLAATVRMGEERFLGTLIIGYFAGKEAVAFYNIATSAAKLVNYIIDPLYEALYPDLVKAKTQNALYKISSIIKHLTKQLTIILIPLAIIIIALSENIIELVFGAAYKPASNTLRVIAAAVVIARLTFWINPLLLAIGRPGLRTIMGVISTIIYLVLLTILVPRYSYLGAGFAYLGYAVIKSGFSIYLYGNVFRKTSE